MMRNYRKAQLTHREVIGVILISGVIGFMIGQVVYKEFLGSVILSAVGVLFGSHEYRKYVLYKQNQMVLQQFNDLLESLFNSYAVGKNTLDSFRNAKEDLLYQYSGNAFICQEVSSIVHGLEHGYNIEILLNDFACRVNPSEIKDFVDVFNSVYRTGGDLKLLMLQSKELITKKIAVELEMLSIMHEQKQQVYILLAMPYMLLFMVEWFGLSKSANSMQFIEVVGRTVSLGLFTIGYFLAKRVVEKVR